MDWVRGTALALGGPGLFLIAFLDSSFLSFPQIVDLLIVVMSTRHPERMVYYAGLATLGSVAGCFVLYLIARKGGETLLRKRFHDRHVDRAIGTFRKYGLLAVAVPGIMPPPVPFKLFVLAAGVAGVRPLDFVLAVALSRGLRYFGEGLLAIWYGEAALTFLRTYALEVTLGVGLFVVAAGVGWTVWQRRARI